MQVRQIAGVALLAALWVGPLPGLAVVSMTAHMILHVSIIALVPALLAPRLRGGASLAVMLLAVLADLVVVWAWHLPAAHRWASLSDVGFVVQQGSFLIVGLAIWSIAEAAGRLPASLLLMATGMHMTMIGALLIFAPVVLYEGFCGGGPFGLDPLEDQQMAGIVMAVVAPLLYFGAGLFHLSAFLAEGGEEGVR